MLHLRQPDTAFVRELLEKQQDQPLRYPNKGATEGALPAGFFHVQFSRALGRGHGIFRSAIQAVEQWAGFETGWTRPVFDSPPRVRGQVAVVAKVWGLWSVNCCRVIDVDLCQTSPLNWTFAMGTLPNHMANGEERVSVTMDPETGEVTYGIRSFSNIAWLPARTARPFFRKRQLKFCEDSYRSMQRYVKACDRVAVGAC